MLCALCTQCKVLSATTPTLVLARIHNFTYSSAPLADLTKKNTLRRWTTREEECFQELKKKKTSTNCLGVPQPKGEVLITHDSFGRVSVLVRFTACACSALYAVQKLSPCPSCPCQILSHIQAHPAAPQLRPVAPFVGFLVKALMGAAGPRCWATWGLSGFLLLELYATALRHEALSGCSDSLQDSVGFPGATDSTGAAQGVCIRDWWAQRRSDWSFRTRSPSFSNKCC